MVEGLSQHDHLVQFYEDDAFLIGTLGRFVGAGFGAGESVLVVARSANLDALRAHLETNGFDVDRLLASKQLTLVDAERTLEEFMVDGWPDVGRFLKIVATTLRDCRNGRSNRRLRIYGEMVDVLCRRGNHPAALALEGLWNDLRRNDAFSLLCGYSMGSFASNDGAYDFDAVCWAHTHVLTQRDDTSA